MCFLSYHFQRNCISHVYKINAINKSKNKKNNYFFKYTSFRKKINKMTYLEYSSSPFIDLFKKNKCIKKKLVG